MRAKAVKSLALACAATLVVSVWTSPARAEEPKRRDPNTVKAAGKVISVSGSTFVLQTPRKGELKVQYDANTKWRNLTADALKAGDKVAVKGTITADVVNAKAIGKAPERAAMKKEAKRHKAGRHKAGRHKAGHMAGRHMLKGEVTKVGKSTFSLETRAGKTVEIAFNDKTTFRGGTAEDLKEGAKVAVAADRSKDPSRRWFGRPSKVVAKVIAFPKEGGEHRSMRLKDRKAKAEDPEAR